MLHLAHFWLSIPYRINWYIHIGLLKNLKVKITGHCHLNVKQFLSQIDNCTYWHYSKNEHDILNSCVFIKDESLLSPIQKSAEQYITVGHWVLSNRQTTTHILVRQLSNRQTPSHSFANNQTGKPLPIY